MGAAARCGDCQRGGEQRAAAAVDKLGLALMAVLAMLFLNE